MIGASSSASVLHGRARPTTAAARSQSAAVLTATTSLHRLHQSGGSRKQPARPSSAVPVCGIGAQHDQTRSSRPIFTLSQLPFQTEQRSLDLAGQHAAASAAPITEATLKDCKTRGTNAFLAGDFIRAAETFEMALGVSEWRVETAVSERLDVLRLRCAALLRLKRFTDALADLGVAMELMAKTPAGTFSAELAQELWRMRAVALLAVGRAEEAAESAGQAMKQHSARGPRSVLCFYPAYYTTHTTQAERRAQESPEHQRRQREARRQEVASREKNRPPGPGVFSPVLFKPTGSWKQQHRPRPHTWVHSQTIVTRMSGSPLDGDQAEHLNGRIHARIKAEKHLET